MKRDMGLVLLRLLDRVPFLVKTSIWIIVGLLAIALAALCYLASLAWAGLGSLGEAAPAIWIAGFLALVAIWTEEVILSSGSWFSRTLHALVLSGFLFGLLIAAPGVGVALIVAGVLAGLAWRRFSASPPAANSDEGVRK